MPVSRINGTEIYHETHGDGFPVVFVHGGYGGLGTGQGGLTPGWVDRFAREFKVILYDRRSSGRSGFPTGKHSMEQFADDILELLHHLGHDRAGVWGTSAGGPITLEFGLRHPEAAASIVVTESAPWLSRDLELLRRLRERIALMESEGAESAYEARREGGTVGLNLFAATRPAQSPEEQEARDRNRDAIRAQLAAIPREERIAKYAGELRTYSAYVDWDATDRFAGLRVPALVVYGTGDTVFPDAGWDRLCEDMPNVTYFELEGAEHGSAISSDRMLNEIRAFFADHAE